MKRKSKSLMFLIVVSLCLSSVSFVLSEMVIFDEEFGFNISCSTLFWQNQAFYSNYTKLFYEIYGSDRKAYPYNDVAMYSYSIDGINWNNRSFSPFIWYVGSRLDFYLEPEGRYLHGTWIDLQTNPYKIYYQYFELLTNGSIILLNQDEIPYTYVNWEPWGSPSIIADNESRPYVAFVVHYARPTWCCDETVLLRCNQNNGSWLSHSMYNFQSEYANVVDEYFYTDLVPTGTNKSIEGVGRGVHWIVDYDAQVGAPFYMRTVSGVNYFDGNGWSWSSLSVVNMNDAEGAQWERNTWSTAYCGNLTVMFKQIEDLTTPDRKRMDYAIRIGKSPWQNRTAVGFDILGDVKDDGQFWHQVAVDIDYDAVFVWGVEYPENHSMWYRKGNVYTNTWSTPITLWQNTSCYGNFSLSNMSGNKFLPYNVPFTMRWGDHTNDDVYHDYLFTDGNGQLDLPAIHYNTTLYNTESSEINDGWIYEGEMYDFVSYFKGADIFYLNFTDGQHDIKFRYDYSTQNVYVESLDDQFVIGEIYTNYTIYSDLTQKVIWRFIPDINIVDDENVQVDFYILNSTTGFNYTGTLSTTFNIYNLGGNTYYTFVGDGSRIPYGTPFELNATDGNLSSTARAEQIFRKLQHINFLMEIDMSNEWEGGDHFDIDAGVGYVDVGFDYRLNATWIDGFKIRLYVADADVGHHAGGNDHNWVEWKIDFYNYDVLTGIQQTRKSKLIYSNHYGYDNENLSPDYHNRTSTQLWIDLWFDRTNASTTVGAQVNSYYYGMREHGSAWWFGYGVFQPMISDYDNAKFLDDLYDEGGNITNVQKFDLIKFYVEVGKVNIADGNDESWFIRGIEDMHRELAIDRMQGIDEPTFVQTKVLSMPQTGFLNAIKSAINGLSKLIWAGAFQFIKLLMGAVGYLAEQLGLGDWWIALSTNLERLATFSLQLFDEMQIALINSALLLTQVFNLLGAGITRFLFTITQAVSSLLLWYGYIVDLFTGGGLFSINVWVGLSLGDWFVFAVHLLPVWWLNRLGKADNLLDTLKDDIMFVTWLITGLFNFLVTIIMLSVALLNLLLGLLPI